MCSQPVNYVGGKLRWWTIYHSLLFPFSNRLLLLFFVKKSFDKVYKRELFFISLISAQDMLQSTIFFFILFTQQTTWTTKKWNVMILQLIGFLLRGNESTREVNVRFVFFFNYYLIRAYTVSFATWSDFGFEIADFEHFSSWFTFLHYLLHNIERKYENFRQKSQPWFRVHVRSLSSR